MPMPRERPVFAAVVRCLCVVLTLTIVPLTGSAADKEIRGRAVVLSGNLVSIKNQTIQLFAIEAPRRTQNCLINEVKMRCGVIAWAELIRIADGAYLSCDVEKSAPKQAGVTVATCYAGEHDIGEALVRAGWAKALMDQSERYKVDQDDAKQSGRGLWAGELLPVANDAPNAEPVLPSRGTVTSKAKETPKKQKAAVNKNERPDTKKAETAPKKSETQTKSEKKASVKKAGNKSEQPKATEAAKKAAATAKPGPKKIKQKTVKATAKAKANAKPAKKPKTKKATAKKVKKAAKRKVAKKTPKRKPVQKQSEPPPVPQDTVSPPSPEETAAIKEAVADSAIPEPEPKEEKSFFERIFGVVEDTTDPEETSDSSDQ